MIYPIDGLRLASTKLHARRVRLTVTIIISSLLFATLAFIGAVAEGVIHSLNDFGKEGYGQRYFVQATPVMHDLGSGPDASIIDELRPTQEKLIAEKKQAAKKLGLQYDEANDQYLPFYVSKNPNGTVDNYPNFMSPITQQIIEEKNRAIPGSDYTSFQNTVAAAGGIATYRSTAGSTAIYSLSGAGNGSFTVIINNKEPTPKNQYGPMSFKGIDTIAQMGIRGVDEDLIKPFVLEGQSTKVLDDGVIPLIAPFSAAEEVLGLSPLPQTATTEQKLSRLVEVREAIVKQTAQLCYRNSASMNLYTQASQQQSEIEKNKDNKDYQKPSLIYNIPETACGAVTVKSDTRNAEQKKMDNNQLTFDKQFGLYQEPEQATVNVRIIGLSPDYDDGYSISLSSFISSMLISSLGQGWVAPQEALTDNSIFHKLQGGTVDEIPRSNVTYYAEFDTLANAKQFISDQTCSAVTSIDAPGQTFLVPSDGPPGVEDLASLCIAEGRPFSVGPYGNNAGALEEFRTFVWKFSRIAILVIMAVASLVMMGNVGKIIADSRRETAVFRSLGAKRMDISQIYLTYILLVSVFIGLVAIAIGTIGAYILNSQMGPDLSVMAVTVYNAQDVHKQFLLYGFNGIYMSILVGVTVVTGLISAVIPLLSNMHRNPINDMRDER